MPELGVAGWRNLGWIVGVNGQQHAVAVKWTNGWRLNMIVEVDGREYTRANVLTRRALKGTYPINVGGKVLILEIGGYSGGKVDLMMDGNVISEGLISSTSFNASSQTFPQTTSSQPTNAQVQVSGVEQELQKAADMLKQGLIDEDEYKELKKKIIDKA